MPDEVTIGIAPRPPLSQRDARLIAEQLADVLEERGLVGAPPAWVGAPTHGRNLDANEVAAILRLERTDWVYAHAAELGGFRRGGGEKPRILFPEQAIRDYMQRQRIAQQDDPPAPARRRRTSTTDAGRTTDAPLIDYEGD
jgi:hypothetical protein